MHKSFYHAGDIGDAIYGLIVMKMMGGGQLWLGPRTSLGPLYQPRVGITMPAYMSMVQLVAKQPYVEYMNWMAYPPYVTTDLNEFRYFWRGDLADVFGKRPGRVNLQHMHLARFHIAVGDETEPWLEADKEHVADVVFARSERYHNWLFPWPKIIAKYKKKACFVGFKQEYDSFVREFPEAKGVKHVVTPSLLQMANIIHASELFVGNQSAPYAIAEGLKVNTIQETRNDVDRDVGADCVFNRPNAQFVRDGKVTLP